MSAWEEYVANDVRVWLPRHIRRRFGLIADRLGIEDMQQEALLALLSAGPPRGTSTAVRSAYAQKIIRCRLIDLWRSFTRHPVYPLEERKDAPVDAPGIPVLDALRGLPLKQRQALVLLALGVDLEESARLLGTTPLNAAQIRTSARKNLARLSRR